MTIAYWCVLAGALMPILWTGFAKFTNFDGKRGVMAPRSNKAPRPWLDTLEGYRLRAHWAQQNAFEAFPAFAAAVIVAHLAGAAQASIDILALAWVGLRLAYGFIYMADIGALRTAVWAGALACVIGLFVVAA